MESKSKDFIKALLRRNPSKRLGSGKRQSKEILSHKYFEPLSFEKLEAKKYKAPWIPSVSDPLDTSNFDEFQDDRFVKKFTGSNKWFKNF